MILGMPWARFGGTVTLETPTNLVVEVQCTQPGLAQFGIAVLCPSYNIT